MYAAAADLAAPQLAGLAQALLPYADAHAAPWGAGPHPHSALRVAAVRSLESLARCVATPAAARAAALQAIAARCADADAEVVRDALLAAESLLEDPVREPALAEVYAALDASFKAAERPESTDSEPESP